ncbi:hypothetical protein FEP95_05578 [Burkholderia multivorans]|nr:hypothetical protein [Burkholderia multivorans]MDR8810466.1 hypothetical protein [Burkholderia multivorans]
MRLEALAIVFTSVTGRHDGDAGVDDLCELRLRLDGFSAAQTVKPLHNQHRAGQNPAVLYGAKEHPKGNPV